MSGNLHTRAEIDENEDWIACGQSALAALLEKPFSVVRPAFPPHSWCNLQQMRAALNALHVQHSYCVIDRKTAVGAPLSWPRRGLVQIFFNGPWDAPGVPIAASYKASHWVAVTPLKNAPPNGEPWVFDINALDEELNHGWLPRSYWEAKILAPLIASFKRATGGWWVRAGIEVVVPKGDG